MNLVSTRDIQNLIATRPRLSDRRHGVAISSHDGHHQSRHTPLPDNHNSIKTIPLAQRSLEECYPPQEMLREIEKVRIAPEKLEHDSPRGNGKEPA